MKRKRWLLLVGSLLTLLVGWSLFYYRHTSFSGLPQLFVLLIALLHFQFHSVSVKEAFNITMAVACYLPIIFIYGIWEAIVISILVSIIHGIGAKKDALSIYLNCLQRSATAIISGNIFLFLNGEFGAAALTVPTSIFSMVIAGMSYSIINLLLVSLLVVLKGNVTPKRMTTVLTMNVLVIDLILGYIGIVFTLFIVGWGLYGIILFGLLMMAISQLAKYGLNMVTEQDLRFKAEKELFLDPKTGVLNYRYLREWLETEFGSEKLALLFIDIDDFKFFNDNYGHHIGDQALRLVAEILTKNVRTADKVIRFGGEEFVVILNNADGKQAYEVAQRICLRVSELRETEFKYPLTVSIGIALYPDDTDNKHTLLQIADSAMYVAKSRGKNQIIRNGSKSHAIN